MCPSHIPGPQPSSKLLVDHPTPKVLSPHSPRLAVTCRDLSPSPRHLRESTLPAPSPLDCLRVASPSSSLIPAEPIRMFKKLKKNTEMKQNIRAKLRAVSVTVTAKAAGVYWALVHRPGSAWQARKPGNPVTQATGLQSDEDTEAQRPGDHPEVTWACVSFGINPLNRAFSPLLPHLLPSPLPFLHTTP